MTDNREPVWHCLELGCDFLDQLARALKGLFGAIGKHRTAILVDDLDIESLLGFLEHYVFRGLGDLRHFLQSLAQRSGRHRKFAVFFETRPTGALTIAFFW